MLRFAATPDGCWDIVVLQHQKRMTVMQTGLISRPVRLENEAGDGYLPRGRPAAPRHRAGRSACATTGSSWEVPEAFAADLRDFVVKLRALAPAKA